MPVRKVIQDGKIGFRWGDQGHVYFGPGAEAKATLQGRAAYAAGYRAEKKKWQGHYLLADHAQNGIVSGQNRQDPTSNTQDFV